MHRVVTTMLRPDTTLRCGTRSIGIGTRCRHRALASAILATGADFVLAALTYAGTDCGKGPAGGGKEGGQVGRTPQGAAERIPSRRRRSNPAAHDGWRNPYAAGKRLLDHVMAQPVGACRLDIARHWAAMHPYPGAGLNEG